MWTVDSFHVFRVFIYKIFYVCNFGAICKTKQQGLGEAFDFGEKIDILRCESQIL